MITITWGRHETTEQIFKAVYALARGGVAPLRVVKHRDALVVNGVFSGPLGSERVYIKGQLSVSLTPTAFGEALVRELKNLSTEHP